MLVSLIVAMDRGGLIGGDSGLPWHLPADLKRFRKLTLGKPVIMGRKTFAQIGRPLPGRLNIVLTHDHSFAAPGCRLACSFPESLAIAGRQLAETGLDEVMVIGGAEVYREALHACGRLYLTVVDGSFVGVTRFPVEQMDRLAWPPAHAEECPPDERNPHRHWFFILERAVAEGWPLARVLAAVPESGVV